VKFNRTGFRFDLCRFSRFLAIWWPLKMQISKKRAKGMIFAIWLIALTITIPWAIFFQLEPIFRDRPDIMMCLEQWPNPTYGTFYFLFANLLACYLMPMIIISICYTLIWIKVSGKEEKNLNLWNFYSFRFPAGTSRAKQKTLKGIEFNSNQKSKS
jgi:hypothetical protein